MVKEGSVKVRGSLPSLSRTPPNPVWDVAIEKEPVPFKEPGAQCIRSIKHHIHDRPTANVSFSGGKDRTAILHLARKAV